VLLASSWFKVCVFLCWCVCVRVRTESWEPPRVPVFKINLFFRGRLVGAQNIEQHVVELLIHKRPKMELVRPPKL
jgi:hypothetical protein